MSAYNPAELLREQLASVTALADNRAVVITARNQEKIAAEQQRDALVKALERITKFPYCTADVALAMREIAQDALDAAGRAGE